MTSSETDIKALPYRPCVGVMLLNRDGMIFAGQRVDNPGDAWQMPQGGIDPGESPRDAALRELGEEVGLDPGRVEILRESSLWLPYDLPRSLVPRLWQGRFRGQTQRWFALRFLGPDDAINIETRQPEFRAWAWMPHAELIGKIVPFKRHIYAQVFDEFADLIAPAASIR
jgi:putative (di)nucleoside polyphosphate hydrolase